MKFKIKPGTKLHDVLTHQCGPLTALEHEITASASTGDPDWGVEVDGVEVASIGKPEMNQLMATVKEMPKGGDLGSLAGMSKGTSVSVQAVATGIAEHLHKDSLPAKSGTDPGTEQKPKQPEAGAGALNAGWGQMYELLFEEDEPNLKAMAEGEGAVEIKAGPAIVPDAPPLETQAIHLMDAKLLGQPVLSTSGGSRYHVVGLSKEVKAAARYRSGQMSIRLEGNVSSLPLAANGFSLSEYGHASIHTAVGADKALARRTMVTLLLGLGIKFDKMASGINEMNEFGA